MTDLETWIQSPPALALATTLLHSLWQAAIVALVLNASLRFIRASRLRYAAACAALITIVAISIGTLMYVASRSAASVQLHRTPHFGPVSVNADDAADRQAGSLPSVLQTALPWITPVWLIGVLLFNVRQAAGWLAARRMRRRGVCLAPDIWQERLKTIRCRLKLARPVVLLESCLTHVPIAVGHARPVILMPLGLLAGLPAEQVDLILMHELAHIRRADYVVNMLQTFVESVMFYSPATWWISKRIRIEREHCCDDIVVSTTRNARTYAAALIALEENRSRQTELALAANGGNLMKRIHRVLQQPDTTPDFPGVSIFAAAVVIVIAAGLLAGRPTLPVDPESPVMAPPQGSLRAWLDEDVVYIINPDDRAAFLRLLSDEERNSFIEQFWRRRDPTPGTTANEFRDEHYRRIATRIQTSSRRYLSLRVGKRIAAGLTFNGVLQTNSKCTPPEHTFGPELTRRSRRSQTKSGSTSTLKASATMCCSSLST